MTIKNIIFDVGNVLLKWDPQGVINDTFKDSEHEGQFEVAMFRIEDWLSFDQGLVTEKEVTDLVSKKWNISHQTAQKLIQNAKHSLQIKPGSIELLEELKYEGYRLFCLTNMSDEFFCHLEQAHDFWHHFEDITVSGRIKMLKPNPDIYEYVLKLHGIEASETVFIDDMQENVDGAQDIGMHAIQFTDAADCRSKLTHLLHHSSE